MSNAASPGGTSEPNATGSGWLLRRIRDQQVAFLLVGATNTAVGFLVFVGFDRLYAAVAPAWGSVLHNTVTLACSHVVSVIIAFVLYRTLVFRVTGHLWRDLARFESVYLVSLAVNWLLLNLLTVVIGLSVIVAQALVVAVIAMVSYFGHKHFSFRRPDPAAPDPPGGAE
jgi:putative flippase GtrA